MADALRELVEDVLVATSAAADVLQTIRPAPVAE